MNLYKIIWPIINAIAPEMAHRLGAVYLKLPFPSFKKAISNQLDEFTWEGLKFRNRVGIAAGLDKDGELLRGMVRMGAGFAEIGTVLTEPWAGNPQRPLFTRVPEKQAVWNRMGFPSKGVAIVKRNLQDFVDQKRSVKLSIGANIGPHPGHLKAAKHVSEWLRVARTELEVLVHELHPVTDFFVVNFSSPNTKGLRSLLTNEGLSAELFTPLREVVQDLDRKADREHRTPILIKLPPENGVRQPWSKAELKKILDPLFKNRTCDGVVAVNTSTSLALKMVKHASEELPGGISGSPLRSTALETVARIRSILGSGVLIIGVGGILEPQHAKDFLVAGADLVEIYTGLVYQGPGLITKAIEFLRSPKTANLPKQSTPDQTTVGPDYVYGGTHSPV